MQIKPLFDRVLVEPKKQKQTTTSGLTLTLQEEGNFSIGKVVEVGDGKCGNEQIDILLKQGDYVLFEDYSAVKIRLMNNTFYVLKQSDILAKVEEDICQN